MRMAFETVDHYTDPRWRLNNLSQRDQEFYDLIVQQAWRPAYSSRNIF